MKNENATPTMKHDGQLSIPHGGLTVRDEFAIAALKSIAANKTCRHDIARTSYAIADAMLSERNK